MNRITGADHVIDEKVIAPLASNAAEKPEDIIPFIPEPKENVEQEAERLARQAQEKSGKGEQDIRPEEVNAAINEKDDGPLTEWRASNQEERLTWRDIAAALGDNGKEKDPESETTPEQDLRLKQAERMIVKGKSFED